LLFNKAIEASESTIADLNQDGIPEILFNSYGVPTSTLSLPQTAKNSQNLYVLSNTGALLFKIPYNTATFSGTGTGNGNGDGAAGAPSVGDLNGDGQLEIVSHTFGNKRSVVVVLEYVTIYLTCRRQNHHFDRSRLSHQLRSLAHSARRKSEKRTARRFLNNIEINRLLQKKM
jgi:hypothetical protein